MSQVSQILAHKGSHVLTIAPHGTVLEASLLMSEHGVGALVVVDVGRVVGIFTERDVLRRVVGRRRDPQHTPVGEVMTAEVLCCTPDTDLEEAKGIFMRQRVRHLPVTDEAGGLLGIVSIGDLNAWQLDGQEQTIHYLHEYIYGRV